MNDCESTQSDYIQIHKWNLYYPLNVALCDECGNYANWIKKQLRGHYLCNKCLNKLDD